MAVLSKISKNAVESGGLISSEVGQFVKVPL